MEGANTDGAPPEAMVTVRNAYKRYGVKQVLKDFNMTVPKGSIYAFLGPSGCGKTTLLGCLVGIKTLDAGEVNLAIQYKHQVGYMPQEVALSGELSIDENADFFANLLNLTPEERARRKKELFNWLEIPPPHRIVKTLSGGEQRRMSLFISLLHNPELVLLDEPTVGLDPLLSYRIWQYLLELTAVHKKTVILTTHYIEEARQAQLVGIMREGTLLVEGEPKALMANAGCSRLEDVFLALSQKQESASKNPLSNEVATTKYVRQKRLLAANPLFVWYRFHAHLMKNITFVWRNYSILAFLLMLPVVLAYLFCWSIGHDPVGLKFGVVNDELKNGRTVDCRAKGAINCSSTVHASCWFMDHLEQRVVLVGYENTDVARRKALAGEVWGYMKIKENYTADLMERLETNLATPPVVVDGSEVDVFLDMTNQYIGNFMKRDVYYSYKEFMTELHKTCNWPVKAATIPIEFNTVYGSEFPDFSDFAASGLLISFEYFMPVLSTGSSLIAERKDGSYDRSIIAGLSLIESFLSNMIVSLVILIPQTLSAFYILFVEFQHTCIGSVWVMFLLCMVTGLCGMSFGYLLSTITTSDVFAVSCGIGFFFSFILLSGMVWPIEALHFVLKWGYYLPMTITTDALRAVVTRDYPITHPKIWSAIIALLLWFAFTCLVIRFVVKSKDLLNYIKHKIG